MNCLLVINTLSGNAAKASEREIVAKYAAGDDVTVKYIRSKTDSYDLDGVEKLIVCGGDGTLNNAVNLCRDKDVDIYYLPYGTFNETAKGMKKDGAHTLEQLGRLGDRDFAYVAAAGSFTDLGQSASDRLKRRFKLFAYFSHVLAAYKVHRIPATIKTDKENFDDVYTLVMFSNAARCFGFRFNKLHRDDSDELQLLLIRSPKGKGLIGMIKMFFPFFRAFFIGFRKEYHSKNMRFLSVKRASLELVRETPFCVDGERRLFLGVTPVSKDAPRARVHLLDE